MYLTKPLIQCESEAATGSQDTISSQKETASLEGEQTSPADVSPTSGHKCFIRTKSGRFRSILMKSTGTALNFMTSNDLLKESLGLDTFQVRQSLAEPVQLQAATH